jgi:Flp pilus assembly protein TadG
MKAHSSSREAGFTLIATGICLVVLFGMLGLAVDLGRLYITKNEAQAFADAGALAAVKQLNGKSTGITAAQDAVTTLRSINRWNMSTTAYSSSNTTVEFGSTSSGPWSTSPSATGVTFARVTATPSLGLTFMSVVGGPSSRSVTGQSIAGVMQATFPKGGYLPYRVVAHQMRGDDNFGLQLGGEYTIRWPANSKPGPNTCKGDNGQPWIDAAGAGGSSERGYFELQSAADIRAAILGQRQLVSLSIGDILNMTSGNKQTERSALEALAARDTDQTTYSPSTNGTLPGYSGNGSRIVILPISASATGDLIGTPAIQGNQVLKFGAFLLPMQHDSGGNKSWCVIYMGGKNVGSEGLSPLPIAGAYVTRLVQ